MVMRRAATTTQTISHVSQEYDGQEWINNTLDAHQNNKNGCNHGTLNYAVVHTHTHYKTQMSNRSKTNTDS